MEGDGGDERTFRVRYDRARRLFVVVFLSFLSGGASPPLQTPHQGPCFIDVNRRGDRTVGRSDQAASPSLLSWTLPSKDSSSGSSDDPMILRPRMGLFEGLCQSRSPYTLQDSSDQELLRAGERTADLSRFPSKTTRYWSEYEYNATS